MTKIFIKRKSEYLSDGFIAITDNYDGALDGNNEIGFGDTIPEALDNLLSQLTKE